MERHGRHIEIRGVVQGVGFRPWVYQVATRLQLAGTVRNNSTGVIVDAFGSHDALEILLLELDANAPPAARVREIEWCSIPDAGVRDFSIVASDDATERNVSIPPDLATCNDCLDEILDPSNRRYRYPFTNCTNCGPRYSIVRGVPYDRDKTTMAPFTMCADCRREYDDPCDRRFHAQPNACPVCGPALVAMTPQGREIATDSPIGFAARAISARFIVAVKGLGGFHLACDATSQVAVQRLRERKHREHKPFAVMVRDLAQAREIAEIDDAECALLTSVARPIVLVRRKETFPGDNPLVGLFLPYTPLHHLLVRECGVPLVMTSGNVSDEPMVTTNEDALARLAEIADVFLMHNRAIETRVDDSVVRVIAGAPTILRRARGYVPRGVEVARPFAEPILAVGAHLKNAVCIGAGKSAFLGPHIGDLETVETLKSFEASIEQLKRFIGVEPTMIAHDLHPEYFSTRYAASQPLPAIAVQHHHAHVVSAMAEHGLTDSVVGIAYDGTGFGTDGTSWGGEILIARYDSFERFATFRAIPLAGGDQAIRQVWRIALALLDEAFDGQPPLHAIPLFRATPRRAIESIRRMIARDLNAPRARGVGRYFDALGAIGLAMPNARYEGEVAFQWNMAADANERGVYPVVIRDGVTPWEVDLRPMVKAAVLELIDGVAASIVSARFHNTIADVTIELARAAVAATSDMPIVLSGGCFQNALLAERVVRGLRDDHRVFMNHDIPPGDGGIALGQAVIANAILRSNSIPYVPTQEALACV